MSNIWCLIIPNPAHPSPHKHTRANKKDTVCLMIAAQPTPSPHKFFSQSINFWRFFSLYGGRDNFVISLPSSTAHFNWILHEFSVVLASCLCIKLRAVPAHLFFFNTIGVTHFNTLVRFVSVSLRPLLSYQSTVYVFSSYCNSCFRIFY